MSRGAWQKKKKKNIQWDEYGEGEAMDIIPRSGGGVLKERTNMMGGGKEAGLSLGVQHDYLLLAGGEIKGGRVWGQGVGEVRALGEKAREWKEKRL